MILIDGRVKTILHTKTDEIDVGIIGFLVPLVQVIYSLLNRICHLTREPWKVCNICPGFLKKFKDWNGAPSGWVMRARKRLLSRGRLLVNPSSCEQNHKG